MLSGMNQPEFRKSSYSTTNGTCVEVAFQQSSFCGNGACVEVARPPGEVLVRDSKNPDGPVLTFTPDEWSAFVLGVKADEF